MTDVNLSTRISPKQERGARTVETILDSMAELLIELGVDRASTNLVSKHAGIAPPSLYRFFPNKYAIIKALADRLMQAQNSALENSHLDSKDFKTTIYAALKQQFDVTVAFKGGPVIMRSLHATPILRDVRLASHGAAAEGLVQSYSDYFPHIPESDLRRHMRLMIEIGYAALEYAFDAPEARQTQILTDAAHMLSLYSMDLLTSRG